MATTIITMEDLEMFGDKLIDKIKDVVEEATKGVNEVKKEEIVWLKSHQVQRMLAISPGTLQNLRVNGTMPFTKVGGVIFYKKSDIENMLEENMRNIHNR